jgi:hypothetical protein
LHGIAGLTLKKKMDAERCIDEKMSLKIGIAGINATSGVDYTRRCEKTI